MNTSLMCIPPKLKEPTAQEIIPKGVETLTGIEQAAVIEGYNNGLQQAAGTFNNIIIALFLFQLTQVATTRLSEKQQPLKFNVAGKEIGLEITSSHRFRKVMQILDNSLFAAVLTMTAFLFIQTLGIPAAQVTVNQ